MKFHNFSDDDDDCDTDVTDSLCLFPSSLFYSGHITMHFAIDSVLFTSLSSSFSSADNLLCCVIKANNHTHILTIT